MDHDDNDFQSENFQLVGEDNNQFPSSLKLFSLPKFELDDHLQIHLRFDGLVEQESLLGLQDQVQKNWIEDFSPGNTELELSSSAAESCSISMQKNIWSEATSSESVEMLLKSVGEDDMVTKKMDATYPESQNGLNNVSDQMTSCYSQDDSFQSQEDKAVGADAIPPPGQCDKDFSRLNKDASAVLPDVSDKADTFKDEESEGRIFEVCDEVSKGENANNPRKAVSEQCGLKEIFDSPLIESFAIKEKIFDNSCSEVSNGGDLNDEFVKMNESHAHAASAGFVEEENKDASMIQIDPIASSLTILANDVNESPTQKFDEHAYESHGEVVCHVKSQTLEDGDHKIGSPTLVRVGELDVQPSNGCTVKNISDSPENPSSLEPKVESLLMEGYNGHGASEKDGLSDDVTCQIKILSGGNGVSGQTPTISCEEFHLVTRNQTNIDGHSVELSNTDNILSISVDSLEQAKEVSGDAIVEPNKISSKDHLIHNENVMSAKNMEVASDCEVRQLEGPAIPTEDEKDAYNHPVENKKTVELCTLSNTNFGLREADEKEDDNLGIHPPELTSQDPLSLDIQRSSGDEVLENDERNLHDSVNGPQDIVQEVGHSPGLCFEHSEKAHISRSQDDRSLEKCETTVETDGRSSDAHSARLLPKKLWSVSSATSDNMSPHMDMENLLEPLSQSQTEGTCITASHVEGGPARVTSQVESGDAINFKETTLQSVGLPTSSSEPCSLEDSDCGPSSFEPTCGSPIVISCTEPSSDELHQQELKKGLPDPSVPLSGNLPQIPSFNKGSEGNEYTACDAKGSNASEEDRSFTFGVRSLPDTALRETADQWKPFSDMQSYGLLQDGEGHPTSPGSGKVDLKILKETACEIHSQTEVAKKSSRKDKSKTVSRSVPERATASKRRSVKESPLVNQADERDGNPCSTSVDKASTMGRSMQLEGTQQHSCNEGGSVKPSSVSSVQTPKLPDSNTAVALSYQPFTDKQQVQLRAQIFVYGSLIQAVPPDEACMISAFGNTDGEHGAWESVWRIAMERFHSQRSPASSCAPPHSHSGVRFHEQLSKSGSLQSKTHGISVSQTSKGAPPLIFNSPVSLPSPMWCASSTHVVLQSNVTKGPHLDSSEIFSPLHVSHSSHGKQYAGNGNPWLSQASPISLVASSQTPIVDTSTHFPKASLPETFHVTPVKNSSVPYCSNLQLKMPGSFTTTAVPLTLPATTVQVEPVKKTEISGPKKHGTTNQKRRKKDAASEVPAQLLPHSQPQTELDCTTVASRHPPLTITMPTVSPVVSTLFPMAGGHVTEQKAIVLEETCSKTVQAKLQAEDAAAVAAAAVRHSEGIWSQLSAQKDSGLVSEMEMKLAYAAVAAAAASSVAKAAAAAAKVASDAALQAKLIADEALINGKEKSTQHSKTIHIASGTNLTEVTSIVILKGKDEINNSSSLIAAAKEAAKRRVEAASAAAKHAENLDMIVKAAELAAVAVSQVGAIMAMGNPLPFTLSDLIEACPEGIRKVQHLSSGTHKEKKMDLGYAEGPCKSLLCLHNTSLNEKQTQKVPVEGGRSSCAEKLKQSIESQTGATAVLPFDISAPEPEKGQTMTNLKVNSIQEGSLVEVLSNESGLRRVWYSANVLNLKDGKAYVCYNEHPNAGSDKLKEWIPLEGECDEPPRIRIAHPTTSVKYEGTRKRRRAVMGNYVWAIADRVDAWIHDGWCEGIVAEKSKEDETKLTVHFPAGGDSLVVSAWHLRPSLIWKDGQWIEWSRPKENILHAHEHDTPKDKRQKLVRIEAKNGNEGMNIGVDMHSADDSRKTEESRPLVLSEKDKKKSLGKSVREASNPDTLRIKRTGLQKEGSKVIFGIPKPGKKRKFMEVSKHYVKEKSDNVAEGSDSIKFAKYLVPQSYRNTKADSKGRQGGELKRKGIRSTKTQSMQTRSADKGEGSFPSSMSTSDCVGTASHEENSEKNMLETASVSNNFEAEENGSDSHQCPVSGIVSSKKRMNFAVGSDGGTKVKVAPSLEKASSEEKLSYLVDHPGETVPDAVEPRRSSRRIQPTSRLLEGLQSSMVTAKIPGLS